MKYTKRITDSSNQSVKNGGGRISSSCLCGGKSWKIFGNSYFIPGDVTTDHQFIAHYDGFEAAYYDENGKKFKVEFV